MDIYKQGIIKNVRFTTTKGELSMEALYTLKKEELNEIAVALDESYEKSGKKSFLVKKSIKDNLLKLKLDIVLDMINTKMELEERGMQESEKKRHNDKILAAIAHLEETRLTDGSLTIDELKAMLR